MGLTAIVCAGKVALGVGPGVGLGIGDGCPATGPPERRPGSRVPGCAGRRTGRRDRGRRRFLGDRWQTRNLSRVGDNRGNRLIASRQGTGRGSRGDGGGTPGDKNRQDGRVCAELGEGTQMAVQHGRGSSPTGSTPAVRADCSQLVVGNREFDAPLIERVGTPRQQPRDRKAPGGNGLGEARWGRLDELSEILGEQWELDTPLIQGDVGRPRGRSLAHVRTVGHTAPHSNRTSGGFLSRRMYCQALVHYLRKGRPARLPSRSQRSPGCIHRAHSDDWPCP